MATVTASFAIEAVDAVKVEIEATTIGGPPMVSIIGLGDKAVLEAADRLEGCLIYSGFEMPREKVIINLAPGDLKKRGAHYDLGMAIALLTQSGQIQPVDLPQYVFIGELSLNGTVRPSNGVLSMVTAARECGFKRVLVPLANVSEAEIIEGIRVIGIKTLREAVEIVSGKEPGENKPATKKPVQPAPQYALDFEDVIGQRDAVLAAMYAAAGGHNILLMGEPGCGKSMIAKRIPGILPEMSDQESMETTRIHSIAGTFSGGEELMRIRPLRAPHHNVSMNALIGGGTDALPGEITLAHNGVLFLDEFAELSKRTLDALRQPMEDKQVTIARVNRTNRYPANFMLVAAMNPCPCGYSGTPQCTCSPADIYKYRKRISGPILDRIEIRKHMRAVDILHAGGSTTGIAGTIDSGSSAKGAKSAGVGASIASVSEESVLSSRKLRQLVTKAREIQKERYREIPNVYCNAQMTEGMLRKFCVLSDDGHAFLEQAAGRYGLSARAVNRVLRLSRTVADVWAHDVIDASDIRTALSLRDADL